MCGQLFFRKEEKYYLGPTMNFVFLILALLMTNCGPGSASLEESSISEKTEKKVKKETEYSQLLSVLKKYVGKTKHTFFKDEKTDAFLREQRGLLKRKFVHYKLQLERDRKEKFMYPDTRYSVEQKLVLIPKLILLLSSKGFMMRALGSTDRAGRAEIYAALKRCNMEVRRGFGKSRGIMDMQEVITVLEEHFTEQEFQEMVFSPAQLAQEQLEKIRDFASRFFATQRNEHFSYAAAMSFLNGRSLVGSTGRFGSMGWHDSEDVLTIDGDSDFENFVKLPLLPELNSSNEYSESRMDAYISSFSQANRQNWDAKLSEIRAIEGFMQRAYVPKIR